jgi:hypothetical protein
MHGGRGRPESKAETFEIIRPFEILADLATNRHAPWCLGSNRRSARRLEAGHGG